MNENKTKEAKRFFWKTVILMILGLLVLIALIEAKLLKEGSPYGIFVTIALFLPGIFFYQKFLRYVYPDEVNQKAKPTRCPSCRSRKTKESPLKSISSFDKYRLPSDSIKLECLNCGHQEIIVKEIPL